MGCTRNFMGCLHISLKRIKPLVVRRFWILCLWRFWIYEEFIWNLFSFRLCIRGWSSSPPSRKGFSNNIHPSHSSPPSRKGFPSNPPIICIENLIWIFIWRSVILNLGVTELNDDLLSSSFLRSSYKRLSIKST